MHDKNLKNTTGFSNRFQHAKKHLSFLSLCNVTHIRILDFFNRNFYENIRSFESTKKVAAFISVGKSYHEGEALRKQLITLKKVAENNKAKIWIVVADSLQKYNMMAKGLSEDKALEKSIQNGKKWEEDNKLLIKNILGKNYRICFWEDILKDPSYIGYKQNIDDLYDQGQKIGNYSENVNLNKELEKNLASSLYKSVKETVENFLGRNDISLNLKNSKHYVEYMKVELAGLDVSKRWGIKWIVYPKLPNKGLQFWNKAFQKERIIKFPRLKKIKKNSHSNKELKNLEIVKEAKIIKKKIGQILLQGKQGDNKKRIDLKTKWNLVKVTRLIFDHPNKMSDDFLEKIFSFVKSNEIRDHTSLEKGKTNYSSSFLCRSEDKIGLSILK